MSKPISFKELYYFKANELLKKREERAFEIDEENQYAFDFFVSYFSDVENLRKLGGKPHKGIFFYGNCGTGKSLFFEILEEVYKCHNNPAYRIKTVNTIELTDNIISELSRPNQLASRDMTLYQKYSTGSVHFEDLGAERKLNHFGNSIEIVSDIIQLRYLKSRRSVCKSFMTSNLSPDQIRKRYGERLHDRFFELFNFVEMEGKSRRE